MKRTLGLAVLCAAALASAGIAAEPEDGFLLQVVTTAQEYDPFMPWQKRRPVSRTGYGVVVGPGLVLTTEYLVRNATLVQLFAPRAAESIPATVLLADHQVGLALLSAESLGSTNGFRMAQVAERTVSDAPFEVAQMDKTRGVQRGEATELRAEVSSLPWAAHASLMHTLLVDLAIGGEAAPVLQNGDLAGICLRYDATKRTVDMLPCGVIRRFMADAAAPPYHGVGAAGFVWRQLVDPWKRDWLGLGDRDGGVLVLACVPESGASRALQPNDVLLAWDGTPLDELGFYDDADFGRLLFPHLIKGRKRPGDTVTIDIMRDRQAQAVEITLDRVDEQAMLIPENTVRRREEYLVEGGFVIREASGRYLRAHGADWRKDLDTALVQLYTTQQYVPQQAGQRVVLLSRVLPHRINVGYQHYYNRIITHVNGEPATNMRAVFDVRHAHGHIHRLTLQAVGVDLVLDRDGIMDANADLQKLYDIPSLYWEQGQRDLRDKAAK